ncbi:hypothetical protein GTX14_20335 [Streptomyces sp. SID4944]|nr:hypothetical protein [Streptomyces sp. SID4944]
MAAVMNGVAVSAHTGSWLMVPPVSLHTKNSGACAVRWKENRPTDPLRHACRSNWSPHLNPEIIGMANEWIKEDALNAKDSGRM